MLFLIVHPEWRNWQTRWTQNPVVLSTVWVRPPPPGPLKPTLLLTRCGFSALPVSIWLEGRRSPDVWPDLEPPLVRYGLRLLRGPMRRCAANIAAVRNTA